MHKKLDYGGGLREALRPHLAGRGGLSHLFGEEHCRRSHLCLAMRAVLEVHDHGLPFLLR
jgi:hypothetical protein